MPQTTFQLDRYDVTAIAEHYRKLPLRVWTRCLAIFLPIFFLYIRFWWDAKTGRTQQQAPRRAVQVRQLLTRLGPAFIKIGQALSTRPDIVPPLYMNELAQLQDQLPAFPNERAFQLIYEELGASPEQIYAEFSRDPIAAASLGQVYKGRLHSGEQVAVKVQRPDIAEGIGLDMYILRGLAVWAMGKFAFIRSNLAGILDEFAGRIFEEMDYNCEGKNAERFAQYYSYLPEIYIPKIYWQHSAKRVLTMEWIEGTKLTDLDKIRAQGLDSRQIIGVGVQCSLRQLLDRGFFHADPHPGNLLVMPDGRLAYLDFGMMSQVTPEQRYGLIEAIVHLVNRDYDALVRDFVRLGFLSPSVDFAAITPALAIVFNEALGASVADLNFKTMTDRLSQIMYDYPFQVPVYYALIIRSLVTLEGIALSVDPNFKVLSVAYPYVANRLLTDETPELRSALKEILFRDGEFRWARLENLLRNAKFNQDYDIKTTVDRVADFLLSERGEYLRDRLVEELAKGIEEATLRRLPVLAGGVKNGQDSSLEHLGTIWQILQQDRDIQPTELLPLAGRLLLKPETQAMGRNLVTNLVQRANQKLVRIGEGAVARLIRNMVLKDEQNNVGFGDEASAPQPMNAPQPISVMVESNGRSPLSREVNGRSW